MTKEIYTLAPSIVAAKARRLYDAGLYQQALEMLERNRVEVEIYPTHVEMRLANQPVSRAGFQKGNTAGSATNKYGRRKPQRGEVNAQ